MRLLQSILFATDFRSASQEAAARGRPAGIDLRFAHVTLLHVLKPRPGSPVPPYAQWDLAIGPLRKLAHELTGQNVQIAESLLLSGAPADTILSKAHEIDADLIVMGWRTIRV